MQTQLPIKQFKLIDTSKESIRYSRFDNTSLAHDSSIQIVTQSRCSQNEGSGPKSAQRYNKTAEIRRKMPFAPSKEDLVIDQYNTTCNLVNKPAFNMKKNYSVTSNKKSNMSQRYEEFNDEDEEEELENQCDKTKVYPCAHNTT